MVKKEPDYVFSLESLACSNLGNGSNGKEILTIRINLFKFSKCQNYLKPFCCMFYLIRLSVDLPLQCVGTLYF